ncbi:hypothetical protein H2248_004405 [Termitomyces sp. 'cryptogamus']|nr:hypothetical protein H2248_004405 [Termitomyces sp. 'cryptogamus']
MDQTDSTNRGLVHISSMSNALCSGFRRLFGKDEPELDDLDLSFSYRIQLQPQFVDIVLHDDHCSPPYPPWNKPEMRLKNSPYLIDSHKPVDIRVFFWACNTTPQSHEKGLSALARYLIQLGHIMGYDCWNSLNIRLSDNVEIRWENTNSSVLRSDALVGLRSLVWKSYQTQLLHSWIPLTPSFLQFLENITISCAMTLDDCLYILSHGVHCKTIELGRIVSTYNLDTTLPRPSSFHRGIRQLPDLRRLELKSEKVEIYTPLRMFDFPALVDLSLCLRDSVEPLQDLESIPWRKLIKFSLNGRILEEDKERIRSRCAPDVEIDISHKGWL